jgi:hypothetical protein
MSDEFIERAESLVDDAHAAANRDGIDRLKAENHVVGDACDAVQELSADGELSEGQMNAVADQLADILARYNKTDLKQEFREYFSEETGDGIPFDEILQERLDELQTVHSTDAKQGTVWRWHFSDGVQLETETSKDGGRKHYDWHKFKCDYFDALIAAATGSALRSRPPKCVTPRPGKISSTTSF